MSKMVLDEDLDDLRWVYEKDEIILKYIDKIEQVVLKKYREFYFMVEQIFENTKNMNKKQFLSYHRTNNKDIFPVLSYFYFQEDFDIKEFFLNNYLKYDEIENEINS